MKNKTDTYGWDNLSKFMAVLSLPFFFSRNTIGLLMALGILGYAIWRATSHNKNRRRREEIIFENIGRKLNYWLDNVVRWFKNLGNKSKTKVNRPKSYNAFGKLRWKWEQKKRFKVVKCPNCSQKLRIPRHKGTLMVTCTKCSYKFKKKT
ncbi:MAG: hypothetical protein ACFWUE_06980 [Xylanivirga thermophila]|jgi:ribosomal protein S27E|uniref:hypothetical protein n=1 Tax=Xylanivirga thermophila TaxID=2496273 RepID=UPI00101E1715|nr:hypothetical protein [Xylanivirga thermophila]